MSEAQLLGFDECGDDFTKEKQAQPFGYPVSSDPLEQRKTVYKFLNHVSNIFSNRVCIRQDS
jgi:hypothetical protein